MVSAALTSPMHGSLTLSTLRPAPTDEAMGMAMIRQAFNRLWNDKRGNVLVIAGMAMPLLFGSVGLATDTIQWALWKRQLQRSADSAAYSGVYARFQSASSSTAANAVVARDLVNAKLTSALRSGFPLTTQPPDVAPFTNTVEVAIEAQRSLIFSSMFMTAAPIIRVTARAASAPNGVFCAYAKENTNASGIIIQGSANVNLGCGMISNSRSASVSVGVNGNAHNVTAEPVAGVGGVPQINGVTREQSYHLPQLDPLENRYSTTVPAGMACGSMASNTVSTSGSITTLRPGCYSGNNQFRFNGSGTTVLQPGTYYLNNTDFIATGGTITGTGVTIILTGTSPGQMNMNGGATLQLSAPTAVGHPYRNLLIMQSPTASNINNSNIINGSSTSSFDGTVYFPNQELTFSGSSAAATKCVLVVARRLNFAGNANIQNNTTGCTANETLTGQIIRLIA